jgi:hypothetical protein
MAHTRANIEAMTDAEFGQLWDLVEAEAWRRIFATKPGQRPGYIVAVERLRLMGTQTGKPRSQKEPSNASQ